MKALLLLLVVANLAICAACTVIVINDPPRRVEIGLAADQAASAVGGKVRVYVEAVP